ncbi:hypothetical protein [Aquiflexum lacus]|uniref:hypothetical protein n=1 Tax=Aquiflexum lacus TaxID=2483805 RepID=UPI0018962DC1|nr:hypothetical protein [Aquiflexum lacus]
MYKLRLTILFFLLGTGFSFGQQVEKFQLGLFHKSNGNIQYINNGKRVIIKTFDGKRIKGEMAILNDGRIFVKGQEVDINEIAKFKSNPIGPKVVGVGIIALGGAVTVLELLISTVVVGITPFSDNTISHSGTGLIIAATGIPFFFIKRSFNERNWIFQVVTE